MSLSDPLAEAYQERPVLVTGHTGFKGAWLCTWLLEMGAVPTGYALKPPTSPSLFETIRLGRRLDHRIGDVRDADAVQAVIEETHADIIVHMAAEALVRRSYEQPLATFATNVLGTVHVLEAVRRIGRPVVVIVVTSDKCYRHADPPRAFRESDSLGGPDPYSASKSCAELVTDAYRRSFFPPEAFDEHGIAVASVRAGNVIGGGDWAHDRIVPDIARALQVDRPIGVRNPNAARPWQYVLDALSGYLWLGARMLTDGAVGFAEAWNFGPDPGSAVTVRALTEQILERWQRGRWEDLSDPDAPPEAVHLQLDTGKARHRLSWWPVFELREAIDATVAWYRQAALSDDMYGFTIEQIHRYVDRATAAGLAWAAGEGVPR